MKNTPEMPNESTLAPHNVPAFFKKKQRMRITQEFSFDRKCSADGHIQGAEYPYHLSITLLECVIQDSVSLSTAMWKDFSNLKPIIESQVFDLHTYSHPNSETLLMHIVSIILQNLPASVSLVSAKLCPTPDSCMEWHEADNASYFEYE